MAKTKKPATKRGLFRELLAGVDAMRAHRASRTSRLTASGPQNTGMFDRITFDPMVLGGRACILGMRIPASVIVSQVAHGASQEEILKDYPDLEPEDVRQAMQYAAWLASEEVHPASR